MPTAARTCPACATPLPEEAHFCLHCGVATPTEPGVPPRTAATGIVEVSKVMKALASHYKVERVLGEGGMATVYLAEDLKHHRKVAIKVMRPELAATLGAERFLREVEIAARLSHPNILPMHDSGQADGFLYYVMPYVKGESLRDRMKREGQLPVEDSLRLAREIAEALAYAHEQGIVHRDMKPANVLLSAGHALVADFGIARALGNDAITQTGLAVGTPQYMSPEQAMGGTNLDGRTDVYSVGAVLYEMLAGEPPFTGPNSQAIMTRSLTEPPRSLTSVRAALHPAVDTLVQRAMAKTPADRYAGAEEFAADLERVLHQVRRGTDSGSTDDAPSSGMVWGIFGVSSAIVLAMLVGLVRRLGLPSWTLILAAALIAVGVAFLVAVKRADASRRRGAKPTGLSRYLTYRNAALGGVLALALWAMVATLLVFRSPAGASSEIGAVARLAVLPFENRGDPDDAYLADGIADEIRGKLASLGGFQVTARGSSDQYRQTTKTPQQIGQELNVDYLLTATVRWAKTASGSSRIQVVPEVINVKTGGVAWQQTFDADLTDVFQVQSQIASRVADAMGVALGMREEQKLEERPTTNLAAYDMYLKGQAVIGTDPASLRVRIRFYEQAVALDSTFDEAWSGLSSSLSSLYSNSVPDPAIGARALAAAERAMAINPNSAVAHTAISAYHMIVGGNLVRASEHIEQALKLEPNNPVILARASAVERAVGQWEQALANIQRARRLDPRSVTVNVRLQNALVWLRRYPEALEASEAALALAPGDLSISQDKAMVFVAQGNLEGAREVIRQVSPAVAPEELAAFFGNYWDMYWVLPDSLQRLLVTLKPSHFDDDPSAWANVLMQTWWFLGDRTRARAYADTALTAQEAVLADSPDNAQRLAFKALAFAYAGKKPEAIATGEQVVRNHPIEKDHINGPYFVLLMARIYHLTGENEKALDLLERLLQIPFYISPGWLRIDPEFAGLKGNPRFDRLVAQ